MSTQSWSSEASRRPGRSAPGEGETRLRILEISDPSVTEMVDFFGRLTAGVPDDDLKSQALAFIRTSFAAGRPLSLRALQRIAAALSCPDTHSLLI